MMSVPEVCDGQSKFILIAEAEAIAAGTSRLLATRHHLAAMCQLAASLRQALQVAVDGALRGACRLRELDRGDLFAGQQQQVDLEQPLGVHVTGRLFSLLPY